MLALLLPLLTALPLRVFALSFQLCLRKPFLKLVELH